MTLHVCIELNASQVISRVKSGETIFITQWGKVVAKLIPVDAGLPSWNELVASGAVTLPVDLDTRLTAGPTPWRGKGKSPSKLMVAERYQN